MILGWPGDGEEYPGKNHQFRRWITPQNPLIPGRVPRKQTSRLFARDLPSGMCPRRCRRDRRPGLSSRPDPQQASAAAGTEQGQQGIGPSSHQRPGDIGNDQVGAPARRGGHWRRQGGLQRGNPVAASVVAAVATSAWGSLSAQGRAGAAQGRHRQRCRNRSRSPRTSRRPAPYRPAPCQHSAVVDRCRYRRRAWVSIRLTRGRLRRL